MNQDQLDRTVYSFIAAFAFDSQDLALDPLIQVYKGYQTHNASPGVDDIIFVMTIQQMHEKKMDGFWNDGMDTGWMVSANMSFNTYQIRCGGKRGRHRLQRLTQIFSSQVGAKWFREYNKDDYYGGTAPVKCGLINDVTEPGDQGGYEISYVCDFTIACRMEVETPQDWAEELSTKLNAIEGDA